MQCNSIPWALIAFIVLAMLCLTVFGRHTDGQSYDAT